MTGLLLCAFAARAEAQPIPTVVQVSASSPPQVPGDMKVTCMKGPNTLDPSPTCPVVLWKGLTYWAFSYLDNRVAMGIVAYDAEGKIVAQWEKPGARYVYAISVNTAAQTVTFAGQSDDKITVTWAELIPPTTIGPVVARVPAKEHPPLPADMQLACMEGPDKLNPSTTCPVLLWNGLTYWAFSYRDNRVAMGIVAYDSADNIIAQWEKPGARYVYAITVDRAAKTVTFFGQADAKITVPWAELVAAPRNIALGKTTSQSSVENDGAPERAVDGDTDGNYSDGSVTHTALEASPWWLVDLDSDSAVQTVTLWNRTDCCADRLSDFYVELLDASGNVVKSVHYPDTAPTSLTLSMDGAVGHFVRVQLAGFNYLSLAEVQVWAAAK